MKLLLLVSLLAFTAVADDDPPALASSKDPGTIVFKVESKDHVQSYLPIHLRLVREDGAEINLKPTDIMKCTANGQPFLVCGEIEYKIAGIVFDVQ